MQVNNELSANYYRILQKNGVENTDQARETAAGIAKHQSMQSQIDIYVQSSQNANEQYDESENNTKSYMDFAADVRKAQAYQTFLNKGGEPSELKQLGSAPETLPVQELPTAEPSDEMRGAATDIAKYKSIQSQIDAYAIGMESSNSSDYTNTTNDYIQNYNEFAQQVRRSEYLSIYTENNRLYA